jgi:hypothetical protein
LNNPILSRHRLIHPYRIAMVATWVMPTCLFIITIALSRGLSLSLLDPRFLLPVLLMCLPAVYIWREGVDVLRDGIIARVHIPRYYPFTSLGTWYLDSRPNKRVLTVWDVDNRKVLECRPGHLTDLPRLLKTLKEHVRYRNWPV